MLITRRYELDMGHCLPDHEGKCYRPHGHRYVVEATVAGDIVTAGNERGMVRDFGSIKGAMAAVLDEYDHRFVMCHSDPRIVGAIETFGRDGVRVVHEPPTAECLAQLWAGELSSHMDLAALRVYETPNCWAVWSCVSTGSTTA